MSPRTRMQALSRPAFRERSKHRKPGDLHTIESFCVSNLISTSKYFDLKRKGRGPREINIDGCVRITEAAESEWRAALEARSVAKAAGHKRPETKKPPGRAWPGDLLGRASAAAPAVREGMPENLPARKSRYRTGTHHENNSLPDDDRSRVRPQAAPDASRHGALRWHRTGGYDLRSVPALGRRQSFPQRGLPRIFAAHEIHQAEEQLSDPVRNTLLQRLRGQAMSGELLDAALRYAARDRWLVFPCRRRGKQPAIARGSYAATTNPETIKRCGGMPTEHRPPDRRRFRVLDSGRRRCRRRGQPGPS